MLDALPQVLRESDLFINFGRNYMGARNGFVYVVSHHSNTAYEVADAFVLARASRERLPERAAWEFFASTKNEEPVWTREVARRAPVLRAPGKCCRAGISYDAPLQRSVSEPADLDDHGDVLVLRVGLEFYLTWFPTYLVKGRDLTQAERVCMPRCRSSSARSQRPGRPAR